MSTIQQMVGSVPRVGSNQGGSSASATRQAVMKAMMGGGRTARTPETGDTSSSQGGKQEVDRAMLEEMVQEMNGAMNSSTSLRFQVDSKTDKLVVRVIDRDTEELIRQIPNEDFLELSRRLRYLQGGLLDARA